MPPPGLLAAPRSGGTTSPSKSELIGADSWGTVPVDSHIAMATEGVDLDAMFAAIDAAEAVSA